MLEAQDTARPFRETWRSYRLAMAIARLVWWLARRSRSVRIWSAGCHFAQVRAITRSPTTLIQTASRPWISRWLAYGLAGIPPETIVLFIGDPPEEPRIGRGRETLEEAFLEAHAVRCGAYARKSTWSHGVGQAWPRRLQKPAHVRDLLRSEPHCAGWQRPGLACMPRSLLMPDTARLDTKTRVASLDASRRCHGRLGWLCLEHDPGITRVVRVPRLASLDELPQWCNVLRDSDETE